MFCSSVEAHLNCFSFMTIDNRAARNMDEQVFSRYIPKTDIAR